MAAVYRPFAIPPSNGSGSNYARQAAAAMHWPSITVSSLRHLDGINLHIPVTAPEPVCYPETIDALSYSDYRCRCITTPKGPYMKPRVTDAQVRVNHETQWLAADVVFIHAAQLEAGPPYTGMRYTYKAPLGTAHKQGLLAHVAVHDTLTASKALRAVLIDAIRTPTTEDKLTAHAWLIVDGDYKTYSDLVKDDADAVAAINKAQADAKLEVELRESLTRTGAAVKSEAHVRVYVGGVYRARNGKTVHIDRFDSTPGLMCPYVSRERNCYDADGLRWCCGADSDETLVEDITP